MTQTFVIADLHGRLGLLEKAISVIPEDGKVVFLGDYIDRGPNSFGVVSCIKHHIANGRDWVALKGNHEDFMVCSVIDDDDLFTRSWMANGGSRTLESYGFNPTLIAMDAEWMNGLPVFHRDEHRVYVHAFAPEKTPIEDEPPQNVMWTRYPERADIGCMGKHVVHGHTPKKNGPELYSNRTNLDCGAVFTGRLVVGVFDDNIPGGPVRLIEVME